MEKSSGQIDVTGFDFAGMKFGIVVALFNPSVSEKLLEGALEALKSSGVAEENVTVIRVPGSFEISIAAQRLAKTGRQAAVICLGTLIRGETPHFDHLSAEVTRRVGEVALKFDLPVTYGVITADTLEQAMSRAGLRNENKGYDAAVAALHMVKVLKESEGGG